MSSRPDPRLRAGLTLTTEPAPVASALPIHWLNDPATRRRFVVRSGEVELVRALLDGAPRDRLARLVAEADLGCEVDEYVDSFEEHCLTPIDGDVVQTVRRRFRETQWRRVQEVVRDAVERIPLYQDRIPPAALESPAAFARLVPPLTRAEYRASFPDQLLPRGTSYLGLLADDRYKVVSTSGTTGERVQVIQSRAYLRRVFNSFYLSENVFETRHAIFGPLQCMGVACFKELPGLAERFSGHALALASRDVMHQSPAAAHALLDELRQTDIRMVLANPFYLASTTFQARRHGRGLPPIDRIYLSYDYCQATTREYLRREHGVTPLDLFGMSEGGLQLMRSCQLGSVHLNEELFYIELEPWRGSSRLLFTTLDSDVTPLVRYQTSDLFEAASDPTCPCGSPLRVIRHFDGRIADALSDRGQVHSLGAIDRCIGAIDGVALYQLERRGDSFRFLYVGDADPDAVSGRVAPALRGLLGGHVRVAARSVASIPLNRAEKFDSIVDLDRRS